MSEEMRSKIRLVGALFLLFCPDILFGDSDFTVPPLPSSFSLGSSIDTSEQKAFDLSADINSFWQHRLGFGYGKSFSADDAAFKIATLRARYETNPLDLVSAGVAYERSGIRDDLETKAYSLSLNSSPGLWSFGITGERRVVRISQFVVVFRLPRTYEVTAEAMDFRLGRLLFGELQVEVNYGFTNYEVSAEDFEAEVSANRTKEKAFSLASSLEKSHWGLRAVKFWQSFSSALSFDQSFLFIGDSHTDSFTLSFNTKMNRSVDLGIDLGASFESGEETVYSFAPTVTYSF